MENSKKKLFYLREGLKNKKKLVKIYTKGWVGVSGGGQFLSKKNKKKT